MTAKPSERLVLSYLDDSHYHREDPTNEGRPACDSSRTRGVPAIRTKAERNGQSPCEDCWPEL